MKLQILIPRYNEPPEVFSPLLDSLALQQSVDLKHDLGVIIADDGSEDSLSDETTYYWQIKYPFSLEYVKEEHGGVSKARNATLDHATADYVMFCDSDDMFFNMCGLYIIFREIENGGFNAFNSVFVEESRHPSTKEPVYINHEMDTTFVHGKVYRRKYLLENGIRWNDSLTVHEDSYFNCLAQRLAGEVKYCQQPFYLWKWRDASVCRHDKKYILKTYNNMLDSNTALVEEFLRRDRKSDAAFYATSMIFDAYYTMNTEAWLNQENREYRNATELRFKTYYENFKDLMAFLPKDQKTHVVMGIRNRFFGEGLMFESITFEDWIRHIVELKSGE